MAGFVIDSDISGLASQLQDGTFSDIVVELADGEKLSAHRVLLASASDVLTKKFQARMADSSESNWQPDVGSAPVWKWIIGWIYGLPETLPLELLVEVLVVADYFQLQPLVRKITALDFGDQGRRRRIAFQLLEVEHCPEVLAEVAAKCVPGVALDGAVAQKLVNAKLQNCAVFVKCLVFCANGELGEPCSHDEALRLKLLGARLRIEEASAFPDCFVDAVRWDAFPAETLKQLLAGDLSVFEPIIGRLALGAAPARLRERATDCIVARCSHLEKIAHIPKFGAMELGEFRKLHTNGLEVRVILSSAHSGNQGDLVQILSPAKKNFGTTEQSSTNTPWISLASNGVMICPEAIGLRHGWSDGSNVCTNFVVEGSVDEGSWTILRSFTATPLSQKGQVYELAPVSSTSVRPPSAKKARCMSCSDKCYFDSFRLRMDGADSSGLWYLMVSWFDIFGHARTKKSEEAVDELWSRVVSEAKQNDT